MSKEVEFDLESNQLTKHVEAGICYMYGEDMSPVCYLHIQEDEAPHRSEKWRNACAHLSPEQALQLGNWLVAWAKEPRSMKMDLTYRSDPKEGYPLHVNPEDGLSTETG